MDNNIIQQNTGVSSIAMPRASGVNVIGIGSGLEALGQGLGRAGELGVQQAQMDAENARMDMEQRKILERQQKEDALNWVTSAGAKTSLDVDQMFTDMSAQAKPGAPNFTPQFADAFHKYAQQAIENAPDYAKQLYGQHLDQLFSHYGQKAIQFQHQATVSNRASTYTDAVDAAALQIAKDPTTYNYQKQFLQQTIPDVGPEATTKLDSYRASKLKEGWAEALIKSNPDAAFRIFSLGTPQSGPAPQATGLPGDASQPDSNMRGIRNNNPGNIVKSDITWQGKIEGQDPKYEAFATPELGIRALGKNLISYQDKHGINTIQGIVSTWAPATDKNDVPAYVADVAKAAGIKPDQPIDLHDPKILTAIATGIIQHENGSQPYSDSQIKAGILAAVGQQDLPKVDTTPAPISAVQSPAVAPDQTFTKTGTPIDDFTLDERLHYAQAASAAAHQAMAEARGKVELQIKNDIAQAATGAGVKVPLTANDFGRAYGQADGPLRFSEYRDNLQLGTNIAQTGTMPDADQDAMLAKMKPVAGSPTYADDQRRYELMQQSIIEARKQRLTDPILFAEQKKMGANPIDFSKPDTIAQELTNRTQLSRDMNQKFKTPLVLLSKDEAGAFAMILDEAPTSQKLTYLRQIRAAVQDPYAYRSIVQQISTDSPVTAAAGAIIAKQTPTTVPHWFKPDDVFTQGDTAGLMLEGESLINKSRSDKATDGKTKGFPLPPDQDMRTQFNGIVGNAFAGDPNGADVAYQAVRAHYAGSQARAGDISGTINSTALDKSIKAVIGGVYNFNGNGQVVVPWGMQPDQFKDVATSAIIDTLTRAKTPGNPADTAGMVGLQSAGDGIYLLRSGSGYLTDTKGAPLKIDLYHQGTGPGAPVLPNHQSQSGYIHRVPAMPEGGHR